MITEGELVGGRYRLDSKLGSGEMGAVWAAQDTSLNRQVAVKLLHAHLADQQQGRLTERFHRECRITAQLRDPGIPVVYDAGEHDSMPYLVMERVSGVNLDEYLARHYPLPGSAVAAIGAQICATLAIAHDAELVHRDLKPSNLMISPTGKVMILDFGVAAVADPEDARLTATGEVVGTVAYMAPEQVDPGVAEPRSDLYSLGCVIYEALTGGPVFDAPTRIAMANKHLNESPRPVHELAPAAPEELVAIVDQLLKKEAKHRPRDARAAYALFRPNVDHGVARLPSDPRIPYLNPCAPPPAPTPETDGQPLAAMRRRSRRLPTRATFAEARERAGQQARAGELAGALATLEAVLAAATPAFGRVDPEVIAARIARADLLLEVGDSGSAHEAYTDVRPDAVRAHGEASDVISHIDAGAAECLEHGEP